MRRLAAWLFVVLALAGNSTFAQTEKRAVQKRPEASGASGAIRPSPKWTGPKRSWGPEQVIGEPDTPGSGDITTAWASETPDDQPEWLICEFEKPVQAIFLRVHETYNPGALVKVTAFGPDGKEVTAWEGEDPTKKGEQRGVSKIPIALGADVQRFKLYIDSPAVRGWNEIDAVAAEDDTGKLHWAVNIEASSTFAVHMVELERPAPVAMPPRVPSPFEKLQQDVTELKQREAQQTEEIRALRQELRELKDLLKKSKQTPPPP
jgi:hypothetical protein